MFDLLFLENKPFFFKRPQKKIEKRKSKKSNDDQEKSR